MQTSTKPKQAHTIPLNTLVALSMDNPQDDKHGLRLFVVAHLRDCDGTPLYGMSHDKKAYDDYMDARKAISEDEWKTAEAPELANSLLRWKMHRAEGAIVFNYPVESLTVV